MNPSTTAFQDQIPDNHCYGCGPLNDHGLQIKSYWTGPDTAECRYTPAPHHCAGPTHFLNGGIISTLIDCHCICTAMAKAYQMAGRPIGEGERLWFATGDLQVRFKRPVPMGEEILLEATVEDVSEKKIRVSCTLTAGGKVCVESDVLAVRVPAGWFE
ncbi:PaaI family thioesterase [Marinobacter sp. R17]|uniref:PaaI family thioesterase n=1 Tax=Marinobacter sp. R17 TaxID=2484250 RepID=UPI000F4CB0DE|nr:PaaI family thioesterase [Marinobacter sp. R17]ROU02205.1 PaaI family thioesterase [Marinobacter sp. R17]